MNLPFRKRRWAATLMLAVTAAAFVAPAAQAGGHYRRWKPGPSPRYSVRYVRPAYPVRSGYYYQRTSSGAAPFITGLIGGAILGTVLSQPHAHAAVAASYYDPYCGISFNSLDGCRSHFDRCDHPQVIRVVEGGRYTRNLCWQNGGWRDWQGSLDFSYRSRDGRDGRWNDRDGRDDGRWNDRDPRWKDDRGWNDRRGEDDRRWNDRRDDTDRRWNDRRTEDDRRFRNRDDDEDRRYRNRDDDDDDDDQGDDDGDD